MSGMHFENELFRETQLRNHWRNTISYLVLLIFATLCAILYHLYNFKNMKNTCGGVLLLLQLKATFCQKANRQLC